MNGVCPACGLVGVTGYVRCPKCRAALSPEPAKARAAHPGGTFVPARGFPVWPVVVGVGVAAAIIFVGVGLGHSGEQAEAPSEAPPAPTEATGTAPDPRGPRPAAPAPAPPAAEPPNPRVAADALEDKLRRERLWGKAEITGARIDVRSGLCADPAMQPAIDSEAAVLRSAGLTKLRCLEQSGAVVFERDL